MSLSLENAVSPNEFGFAFAFEFKGVESKAINVLWYPPHYVRWPTPHASGQIENWTAMDL